MLEIFDIVPWAHFLERRVYPKDIINIINFKSMQDSAMKIFDSFALIN